MKILDFLFGIVIVILGLLPFLLKVESIAEKLGILGKPGDLIYQGILIALGIIMILASFAGRKK